MTRSGRSRKISEKTSSRNTKQNPMLLPRIYRKIWLVMFWHTHSFIHHLNRLLLTRVGAFPAFIGWKAETGCQSIARHIYIYMEGSSEGDLNCDLNCDLIVNAKQWLDKPVVFCAVIWQNWNYNHKIKKMKKKVNHCNKKTKQNKKRIISC